MLISLLQKQTPFIDLRAPIEYLKGSLPTSTNLPILLDDERELVGKTYKELGQQTATKLGHSLVKDQTKDERIEGWIKFINHNPNSYLYCARGGQRSEIAQEWISENGIDIPRIEGGFKSLRNTCLNILDEASADSKEWIIIAGKTGSNKTGLVSTLTNGIDLEKLANHRGSAFGGYLSPQPSPIDFENSLACNYLKIFKDTVLFEDESRAIGRLVIPEKFYNKMVNSKIVIIDQPLDQRVKHIYIEYVLKALEKQSPADLCNKLKGQLEKISKRLGMENYSRIDKQISLAFMNNDKDDHCKWIEQLLQNYYDKMYDYQLEKKKDRCIYKGTWTDTKEFLVES